MFKNDAKVYFFENSHQVCCNKCEEEDGPFFIFDEELVCTDCGLLMAENDFFTIPIDDFLD